MLLPIIAKLLGAHSYGLWTQTKIAVAFLAPVVLLGLNHSVVRFLAGDRPSDAVRREFSGALASTVALACLAATLVVMFEPTIGGVVFGDASVVVFVRLLACFLLLEVIDQLATSYLQAFRRFLTHAGFVAAEVGVEVALVALLAVGGSALQTILGALVVLKLVIVAAKLVMVIGPLGMAAPRAVDLRRFLAFGIPLTISNLFYFVMNYSDRYLIGWMLDIRQVGVYSLAYTIGGLPLLVMTPVEYILYPTITAAWNRGDLSEVERHIRHALRYTLLLVAPLVALLVGLPAPIIVLVATPEFSVASSVTPWVAIAFVLLGLGIVGQRIMMLMHRTRLITALYGGLAALNVALNVVLIPRLGIRGAAIATLLTYAAYAAFTLRFASSYCRIGIESAFVLKLAAATVAMIFVLRVSGFASLTGVAGGAMIGALVYLGCLVVARTVPANEIGQLRGVVTDLLRARALRSP